MGVEFSEELILTASVLLGFCVFPVSHDLALNLELFLFHHGLEAFIACLVFLGYGEAAFRGGEVREGARCRESDRRVGFLGVPHPEAGSWKQFVLRVRNAGAWAASWEIVVLRLDLSNRYAELRGDRTDRVPFLRLEYGVPAVFLSVCGAPAAFGIRAVVLFRGAPAAIFSGAVG